MTTSPRSHDRLSRPDSSLDSELHVLVRRRERVASDVPEPRILHARSHAPQSADLPDRREDRLIVNELLYSLEENPPLLRIQLSRLLAEKPVDVTVAPVDIRPT